MKNPNSEEKRGYKNFDVEGISALNLEWAYDDPKVTDEAIMDRNNL